MVGPTPRTALGRGRDVEERLTLLELRQWIPPERLVSALSTAADANDLIGTGSFWVMPTTLNSPPTTAHYVIEQYELSSGTRYQLATRIGTPTNQIFTERWTRTRTSSGTWTAWIPISLPTTTYTPTLTGLTQGNGTLSATYSIADGVLTGRIVFVLGSTSTVTSDIRFSHPPYPYTLSTKIGGASRMSDSSTGIAAYGVVLVNASYVYARALAATTIDGSTSYTRELSASASIPFAWAAGDSITLDFEYPII